MFNKKTDCNIRGIISMVKISNQYQYITVNIGKELQKHIFYICIYKYQSIDAEYPGCENDGGFTYR